MHLDQELLKNIQCSGSSEVLQRIWESWRWGVQSPAISFCQWPIESHDRSWSSYNYMRSCWRTQHWPVYGHSAFEANWKDSSCLMSRPEIKKSSFWRVVFSYSVATTMNYFLIELLCATNSRFYMTTRDDQSSGWTEKKLQSSFQSQSCTKKTSHSLFGDLLPIWSTTVSWITVKPFYLKSIASKLIRCTENWKTCSQLWSTERAQFFSTTTLNHMLHNQCSKSWTNWTSKFCLICHIHLTAHQLITTSSSISTSFCEENASTTSGT